MPWAEIERQIRAMSLAPAVESNALALAAAAREQAAPAQVVPAPGGALWLSWDSFEIEVTGGGYITSIARDGATLENTWPSASDGTLPEALTQALRFAR